MIESIRLLTSVKGPKLESLSPGGRLMCELESLLLPGRFRDWKNGRKLAVGVLLGPWVSEYANSETRSEVEHTPGADLASLAAENIENGTLASSKLEGSLAVCKHHPKRYAPSMRSR